MLNVNDYQILAMRTSRNDISEEDHLMNAMLGLAGETGECCDLVKKNFFQDGRDIREKLFDELSDVCWYIAEAATCMGWTLEDIMRHNIKKLEARYPTGFDADKSLHREES